MPVVITLAIGLLGGFVFRKLHVTGAFMVGSALFVAVAQLLSFEASMPQLLRTIAQLISGTVIGLGMNKGDLLQLPRLWKGFLVLMVGFFVINLLVGATITLVSDMNPLTAYFGAVPGGIGFMPLLASEYGADPGIVGMMGIFRLFIGIAVFPSMVHWFSTKVIKQKDRTEVVERRAIADAKADQISVELMESAIEEAEEKRKAPYFIGLPLIAVAALLAQRYIGGLPLMIYAMLGSIALNLSVGMDKSPTFIKRVAQWLSGSYIGASFGMDKWQIVDELILPILILLAFYGIGALLIGWFVHKAENFPIEDSCFCAIPAGATDIALITEELGINNPTISIYHALRASIITSIFPLVIIELVSLLYS